MKSLCTAVIILLLYSCQKEINFPPSTLTDIDNIVTSRSVNEDGELSPPMLLMKMPDDGYYPYELIQYIRLNQAINSIPPNSRYYQRRGTARPVGGSTTQPSIILADMEPQQLLPALNLADYLKCFATIPDHYATCKMEIFTDIPVDNDPGSYFDWSAGFPGHAFIQLTKTNGSQTIVRTIGFYPASGLKALVSEGAVPGKFVDNGRHEYNASMSIPITPAQLNTAISSIIAQGKIMQYSIDNFNCTNFALGIFNKMRPADPIIVPKINYFGSTTPRVTPQGLYLELLRRRGLKPPNRAIYAGTAKQYAAPTSGNCK